MISLPIAAALGHLRPLHRLHFRRLRHGGRHDPDGYPAGADAGGDRHGAPRPHPDRLQRLARLDVAAAYRLAGRRPVRAPARLRRRLPSRPSGLCRASPMALILLGLISIGGLLVPNRFAPDVQRRGHGFGCGALCTVLQLVAASRGRSSTCSSCARISAARTWSPPRRRSRSLGHALKVAYFGQLLFVAAAHRAHRDRCGDRAGADRNAAVATRARGHQRRAVPTLDAGPDRRDRHYLPDPGLDPAVRRPARRHARDGGGAAMSGRAERTAPSSQVRE